MLTPLQYIALERLESTYKSCHLVSNICVHANTDAKQPIAIIIPHEANLRSALGDKSTPLADMCTKDDVRELMMRECNAAGKKQGFKPMEMLEAVILTPEEWTPESGLVTAAQKVQRKKIAQKFDDQIKACLPIAFFEKAS
jgi:long-chain acyl-CoA synthetase